MLTFDIGSCLSLTSTLMCEIALPCIINIALLCHVT